MTKSILAIDVGNTNITMGLMHGLSIVKAWHIDTDKKNKAYKENLPQSLSGKKDFEDIVMASVVPEVNDAVAELCIEHFGMPPIILSAKDDLGVKIRCKDPSKVGVDRIANTAAAVKIYKPPVIVVDFGTAITFDVVNDDGEYIGGVIAPGLGIARDALKEKSSLLPYVNIVKPDRVSGDDTQTAMQSGIYWGFVGMIRHLIKLLIEEKFYNRDITCVATGGYTSYFIEDLPEVSHFDGHLTLKGLKYIYDYLKK